MISVNLQFLGKNSWNESVKGETGTKSITNQVLLIVSLQVDYCNTPICNEEHCYINAIINPPAPLTFTALERTLRAQKCTAPKSAEKIYSNLFFNLKKIF